MTLGNQPYPGRINQEVLQYVTGGGRLDRPEKCPGRMYVNIILAVFFLSRDYVTMYCASF